MAPPPPGLTFNPNGTIYGTTTWRPCRQRHVFQLTPPSEPGGSWTETVLYSFTGQNGDGAYPQSVLVLSRTHRSTAPPTRAAPSRNRIRHGLRLVPSPTAGPWTEVVLHSFTGQNGDGSLSGSRPDPHQRRLLRHHQHRRGLGPTAPCSTHAVAPILPAFARALDHAARQVVHHLGLVARHLVVGILQS